MAEQTITTAPDTASAIRHALAMLRTARPGGNDDRAARTLLTECGITVVDKLLPEHRDRVWRTRAGEGWTISWNPDRGMWHDERRAEADRDAWISQQQIESRSLDAPYVLVPPHATTREPADR